MAYLYGAWSGPEKDLRKAVGHYEAALGLDARHTAALNNLAAIYLRGGPGVPADYTRATSYLERSAEARSALGLLMLGDLYADGRGVVRDLAQARINYRTSAELGNVTAMRKLADLYEAGQGGPIDREQARVWREKAASAAAH